jgi:hypothetical protein
VIVLLVVLIVTNLVTLGLVLLPRLQQHPVAADADSETFTAPRPAGVSGRSRRLITIEILNPIELVSSRGRIAGLAGSLAPGFARRMVYDQTLKILRRELEEQQVLADVRLHTVQPRQLREPREPAARRAANAATETAAGASSHDIIDLQPVVPPPTRARQRSERPMTETVEPIDLDADNGDAEDDADSTDTDTDTPGDAGEPPLA